MSEGAHRHRGGFGGVLMIVIALVVAGVPAELVLAQQNVTCESSDRQRRVCRVDTTGGVTLVTQLSSAGCFRGSTWDYDDRGVWVANGCRAIFHVGAPIDENGEHDGNAAAIAGIALAALGAAAILSKHHEDNEDRDDYYRYDYDDRDYHDYHSRRSRHSEVVCESVNNGYSYCGAPVHGDYVRIIRQMSSSGCTFDQDWGYDSRGIWVDNGCRARFEIEH